MQKYFMFAGRINRQLLIIVQLTAGLLAAFVMVVVGLISGSNTENLPLAIVTGIIDIILIWLSLSLDAQRLHDLNRSGWHVLLLLVPLYNIYLVFVLLLKKGTEGPNQYGPDPLSAGTPNMLNVATPV